MESRKAVLITYLWGSIGHANVENRLLDPAGEGAVETI